MEIGAKLRGDDPEAVRYILNGWHVVVALGQAGNPSLAAFGASQRFVPIIDRGHDPAPPLGSMIIRAANAFDDMVGTSIDRERCATALDHLRLDATGYDAGVVAALAEVAGRRVPSRM